MEDIRILNLKKAYENGVIDIFEYLKLVREG